MSDADNFLTRWARRKRAVAEESVSEADEKRASPDAQVSDRAADTEARPAGAPAPAPDADALVQPAFDLTKLPSIESITADTDIRGFFAPGVPAELTRAALRRAWVADPKIKDFVGLAENSWDFNNPGSIPGFGPLEMTDELRREVARIVGNLVQEEETAGPAPAATSDSAPPSSQPTEAINEINADVPSAPAVASKTSSPLTDYPEARPDIPPSVALRRPADDAIAAVQKDTRDQENLQTSARRGHGRALPK